MRTHGSAEQLEARRRRAVRMVVEDEISPAKVASSVGASRRSADRWVQAFREGGEGGLANDDLSLSSWNADDEEEVAWHEPNFATSGTTAVLSPSKTRGRPPLPRSSPSPRQSAGDDFWRTRS